MAAVLLAPASGREGSAEPGGAARGHGKTRRGRGSEAGPRGPGGGAVRASQVPGRRRGGSARPGELGRAGMLRAGASGACLPGDLVAKQKQ